MAVAMSPLVPHMARCETEDMTRAVGDRQEAQPQVEETDEDLVARVSKPGDAGVAERDVRELLQRAALGNRAALDRLAQ